MNVEEVMLAQVVPEISVDEAMSLESCVRLPDDGELVLEPTMGSHQVRRIPIVDQGGQVVAVVRLGDQTIDQWDRPTRTSQIVRWSLPLAK